MGVEPGTQHWLLLRGLGRERRHWGRFLQQFSQAIPHAQLHCIDLPGNGREYRQRSLASIPEMVDWLRKQPRPQGPMYLLGLSLGGMLAWHWMQHWPEEVAAVVMVNSSLAPINSSRMRLMPRALPPLLQALLWGGTARERIVFELTCQCTLRREQTLRQWLKIQQMSPVRRGNVVRQLLAAGCYRAEDERPRRPLLLVNGAEDQLVNPGCSVQLAQRWRVPLKTHPQAGHDLPFDRGDWLAEQIQSWLEVG